jgi:hypothetical protein
MTRTKKPKAGKGTKAQLQWNVVCETAKHGTYAFLQQCMVRMLDLIA